jgi:hypothetical protein
MNRSDMRALGRIGQPLSGGTYRPRRRFRAPRWAVIALVLVLGATVWIAAAANREAVADRGVTVAAPTVPPRPEGSTTSRSADRSAVGQSFAMVDDLALTVPHRNPITVAFHEASRVEALEMTPVGRLQVNDNTTRFQPPADTAGPDYRVLSSRGRAAAATSAVDIVVPLGDSITAPVTGRITQVTEYPLYGQIRDWRVEIAPQGRPDLAVVVIHLLRPSVSVGDSVTAGRTPLGVVRLLPFDSHVDYASDEKQPHAHIEVKPSVDTVPIDPNAPALPADDGADL